MRITPKPATLLASAVIAGALALSGCTAAADAPASTPEISTPGSAAPANVEGFGIAAGTGPVEVALWTDLSCPYCALLEADTGELLAAWVDSGDITLTIHPLNFVSAKRGDDTDWSTRAANALAAAADAGHTDAVPALYALLQQNQVSDAGAPTDEEILALAAQAGVTGDISDAVTSQRFSGWVTASNDHWLGSTIEGTEQVVQGVPILVVDGAVFEIQETNAARLRAAVEAALAG
ncbi:DsbA family protein [Microbacterium invictum]|uniref:Protein-disulfide isomerase n=1 Tax=Microbacterium invictum TaxID=515415 RepID=A0AA40VLV2_9MICO|nr:MULTISPECIES: thioredoxin domain-containing protein [Microbacterium]MBB4139741.1 protein-disulfide isomerase [Microbacterium invictum]